MSVLDFKSILESCEALATAGATERRAPKRRSVKKDVALLVDRVNDTAIRRRDLVTMQKGRPKTQKVRGKGRYKAFTPKTMLRTTLGNTPLPAIKHKSRQTREQVPAMFSLSSTAYWLSSSTRYIASVRNTIVNLFLQLQSVLMHVALMTQPTRPSFVKMHLHWDETGQAMRLRRGLIEVEGVMSVLVQRMELLVNYDKSSPWRHHAITVPPAVLHRNTSEGILAGMRAKLPFMPQDLHRRSERFCLYLLSDAAGANIKLASHLIKELRDQQDVAVPWCMWKDCDTHAANHVSEPLWRAMDILSPMFCLTNVLSNGSSYFDLLMHIWHLIDTTAIIEYGEPDASVLEQNRLVLDATFLHIPSEDDAEECVEGLFIGAVSAAAEAPRKPS